MAFDRFNVGREAGRSRIDLSAPLHPASFNAFVSSSFAELLACHQLTLTIFR